jgi:hypothetical protein
VPIVSQWRLSRSADSGCKVDMFAFPNRGPLQASLVQVSLEATLRKGGRKVKNYGQLEPTSGEATLRRQVDSN